MPRDTARRHRDRLAAMAEPRVLPSKPPDPNRPAPRYVEGQEVIGPTDQWGMVRFPGGLWSDGAYLYWVQLPNNRSGCWSEDQLHGKGER